MTPSDPGGAMQWLTDGARSAPTPEMVLEQLCARLVAADFPLWRVAVFVRTLHPDVRGRRFLWQSGEPVAIGSLAYERETSDEYRFSPVAWIYANPVAIRRHLRDAAEPLDFAVLNELRARGATDYLATPLFFSNGEVHVASWTTQRSGGFSDEEIGALERLAAPLARIAEIHALRRIATNLLDTYVGHQAGGRILAGRIRRGDTESIHAAIWLSDMRGFTTLSDRLPPAVVIALLNRYFDCQVPAILSHGGEVLKFIGDGLLAIFPIIAGQPAALTCGKALAAARQAHAEIKLLAGLQEVGIESLQFGLALHLGQVLYGNIGGSNRLDFTCIGPAVNLAARLEKLTAELHQPILASADFANQCAGAFMPIGDFALRGFSGTQRVFGFSAKGET